MIEPLVFYGLSAMALVGALGVVLARDVMRFGLGLGAFLAALAGLFALFGFGFLALAEIFVYVGGVLILMLFAIMLVHRPRPGSPELSSRHDPLAAVAAVGVSVLLWVATAPLIPAGRSSADTGIDELGAALLGPLLPHFLVSGVLLLAALVSVVAVSRRGDRP